MMWSVEVLDLLGGAVQVYFDQRSRSAVIVATVLVEVADARCLPVQLRRSLQEVRIPLAMEELAKLQRVISGWPLERVP